MLDSTARGQMILHCYVPGLRENDQAYTRAALARLSHCTVIDVPMAGPTDYAQAVRQYWTVGEDLLIVEQDMAPWPAMVDSLFDCREHACTQAYWLAPASSGMAEPVYAARGLAGQTIIPGERWASASGIGLVRLSLEIRERMGSPDVIHYTQLDGEINRRLRGTRVNWHVHWPACPHYHGFMEKENDRLEEAARA